MIGDSKVRYGVVTRSFHWIMALGFLWMLFTATARFIDKDAELTKAVFAYHGMIGFTILWVAVLRIIWSSTQSLNRPKNDKMVKLGHFLMYALMIIVPLLALIRTIGGGRAFNYLGVEILAASETKTQWMIDLGNNWHGNLGWLLFLLIFGHIAMAVKHRLDGNDVWSRMIGK